MKYVCLQKQQLTDALNMLLQKAPSFYKGLKLADRCVASIHADWIRHLHGTLADYLSALSTPAGGKLSYSGFC